MLPKKNRLDLRKTQKFFEKCQKKHFQELSLYFIKSGDVTQATVIVPKKTAKLATQRSKIKRCYREAIRETINKFSKSLQLVVIVHPEGRDATVKQITEKLQKYVSNI